RRMAGRVVDALREELGPPPDDVDHTIDVRLPGAPTGDLEPFRTALGDRLAAAGVEPATIRRLLWLYGRQLDDLIALAEQDPCWLEPLGAGVPAVRGEVKLAVEREMAIGLSDFMDRRAALLLFSPGFGLAGVESAAEIMADLLGWDSVRRAAEIAAYELLASEHGVPRV
ncbi:MAG TPA: glycerol-3-phosphate dehydrogenase C-terminal domain-containing protein, partial [Longimicrobiales bacterium]|nr:glycerol-3-phosphate dehydrogenase C-terminal domain-containing protein [Longimicrobiales bacterium]